MRIISNEPYIKRRVSAGKVIPPIALGFLIASIIVLVTRPELFGATMVLVSVGFVLSLVGNYLIDHFSERNGYHVKLLEALKGIDDAYTLLVYQSPVPFVLVGPDGATVILVKNTGGHIVYEGGEWVHHRRLFFRFLAWLGGREGLGKPDREVEDQVARLERYLDGRLPEEIKVPVHSLILFVSPRIQLSAEDSPIPTLRGSKVRGWFSGPGRGPALPAEARRQMAKALNMTEGE